MLLRRNRIVIHLGTTQIVARRDARRPADWELLAIEPVRPALKEEQKSGADDDGEIFAALERIVTKLSPAIKRAGIAVTLAPALCPGLVIDLGEEPVPARVRAALAQHRVQEILGIAPPTWRVRLDAVATLGPALVFACHQALVESINATLQSVRATSIDILPEVVWASNRFCQNFENGWLLVDNGSDVTGACVNNGRMTTLDVLSSAAGPAIDWRAHVKQNAFLQGVEMKSDFVQVVSLRVDSDAVIPSPGLFSNVDVVRLGAKQPVESAAFMPQAA